MEILNLLSPIPVPQWPGEFFSFDLAISSFILGPLVNFFISLFIYFVTSKFWNLHQLLFSLAL
jgi:hypothetical protein